MQTGCFFQAQTEPGSADIALLGLPWDGTVSNRPGARFGPQAIRRASLGSEDYSPYRDADLSDLRIHDRGDLELPFGDTDGVLEQIRTEARSLLNDCPRARPVFLGGEHLLTLPLFEVCREKFGSDLFVLQLDAHADLRSDYLGVEFSHATVMNRIVNICGLENTALVGVRSGSKAEWRRLGDHPHRFAGPGGRDLHDFPAFVKDRLAGRPVYLTLDLDVFDPALLSGTGTPEPGGIFFPDFIRVLEALRSADVLAADIMELAPDYDSSGVSAAVAATALREIMFLLVKS